MSSFLGIEPTTRPDYYFVSYNNEDAERLTPLMVKFVHYNIPLWYDYGIEYGSKWENEIADRIQGCQAVLLFLTKGIFLKEQSYVRIEYDMATRFFEKAVYTVIIDEIDDKDIPNRFLGWWIDLKQKQSLVRSSFSAEEKFFEECKRMLKINTFENRSDTIMNVYNQLILKREYEKATNLLSIIVREAEIKTKASMMMRLYFDGYADAKLVTAIKTDNAHFIKIRNYEFSALYRNVFHRIGAGDADVIDIVRNGKCIYTIGGLVDAYNGVLFYDEKDDFLFILYSSYPNVKNNHPYADLKLNSVCVVEDPCGTAVCHEYRDPLLCRYMPQ